MEKERGHTPLHSVRRDFAGRPLEAERKGQPLEGHVVVGIGRKGDLSCQEEASAVILAAANGKWGRAACDHQRRQIFS